MDLHLEVINETGGLHGVRDKNAILSAVDLPKQIISGKEAYATTFLKAGVYARSIIMGHPFSDGNKRTGMVVPAVFLEKNNYKIVAKQGSVEKFALHAAKENPDLEEIAEWFEKNSSIRY